MNFHPALGINLKDYNSDILNGKKWRVSEKVDGVRRYFYKTPTSLVICFSRTGKQDKWLPHITSYLQSPWFPSNTIYDCEIVHRKLYFEHPDSFILRTESSSIVAQQYKDNKLELMAICFDIFQFDKPLLSGLERDKILYDCFGTTPLSDPVIKVPSYGVLDGNDQNLLSRLLNNVILQNGEGLMLLNLETPYIQKRSTELIKVKKMMEVVGRVIDVELALPTTKIAGGIAALICDVPGCNLPVRVGTGFSLDERLIFAKHSPLGMEIEIEAFSRSVDKKGNISLSMPVFKQMKGSNI